MFKATEYRLQGEWRQARKGCLTLFCLPALGPDPSSIGPNFLITELAWMRALCRSAGLGEATRLPQTALALLTPRWGALLTHLCKDVFGELKPGSSPGFWEP